MIVIVPTNRPERIAEVVRQWRAQTLGGTELAIAPSVAAWSAALAFAEDATILPPRDTIGEARNVGLEHAREREHEWAAFWDDDNHHGPDYLAEVAREGDGWDVLSKGLAFVRHDSGLWLYAPKLGFFPGHSTSVRVAAALDFPAWSLSEDVEWSKRMKATGARAKHLPPWGLVYDRRSPDGHAYDAAEAEFLAAHGPARCIGDVPDTIVDEPFAVAAPAEGVNDENMFAALARRSKIREFAAT